MTDAPLHPGLNLGVSHGEAHEDAEIIVFGFWVFLMSDLIIFGILLLQGQCQRCSQAFRVTVVDCFRLLLLNRWSTLIG